jgi:L-cystine uptake protein TcyP (sodium:dicarboxylate symporter family)
MGVAWLDLPTVVVAVVYAITCLPLAWAHATLSGSRRERVLIWTTALVLALVLLVVARALYVRALGLTRGDADGSRSLLLQLGLAGFIGIALCAPVGLAARQLLKRRRPR